MTTLLQLPVFDSSYANCEGGGCELRPQLEKQHFCCAYRPEKFNSIMIIGEGPGHQEVAHGRPFIGPAGQLLKTLLLDVGIDLDECFVTNATLCVEGTTQVRLADGSLERIDMLVKRRGKVRVQTVSATGELTTAPVVDWFRNRRGNRALVRVGFRYGKQAGPAGPVRAIVTEDHPVRTPTGWTPAGQLRNGDLIATDQVAPRDTALEIALGSIVGDGCITKRSTFQLTHGRKQRQYAGWKRQALSSLGCTLIESEARNHFGFATRASAFWRAMYDRFYQLDAAGHRHIPRDFIDTITPLTLAVWFMDDGHLAMRGHGRKPNASLSLVSYNRADVEYLATRLTSRGLICSVSAKGVVLFSVAGTKRLSALIRGYVPADLQYKLLPADRGWFEDVWYAPIEPATFYDEVRVEVVSPRGEAPNQPVYCLEVEGTHNFATPGAILHNCKPPPKDKSIQDAFPKAIPSCIGRLEAEIAAVKPKIIIPLGAAAWIAISGYDVEKTKTVPFDCDNCDPLTRKVGPVLQCGGSIVAKDGKTSKPCGWLHYFDAKTAHGVNAEELHEVKSAACPQCNASFKRLRPKMIKCPVCGGRKRRNEQYTVFDWDYNISAAAGAIFEPAKPGVIRKDHELDSWLGEQGVQYVIPTYHPAFLLRGQQFHAKSVQKHFQKVQRLLRGAKVSEVAYRTTSDPAVVRAFCYGWEGYPIQSPHFSFDIETESIINGVVKDARKLRNVTKIKCIGISTLEETLVVDTRDVNPADENDPLLAVLYDFLTDERIEKSGHHIFGYDLPVIELVWGIPCSEMSKSCVDDTMHAHINLYPDEPHDLSYVTFECTDVHAWKPARTSNGAQVHKSFEELALYNARDTWHTALVRDHLGIGGGKALAGGRMDRAGLSDVYSNDSRLRQIALNMTMNGIPLNYRKFREVGERSRKLIADAELTLRTALREAGFEAADELNPNSGPQLVAVLFGPNSLFKLQAVDMASQYMPATTKVAFQKLLSTTDNAFALKALGALIELRKQQFIARNFVFSPDMQPWKDRRIHPIWKPWGTRTGRFSSSPNAQNIPIWLREAFEAPDGRCIVGADADQLELRMIAWLSGDKELIRRSLTADESRKLEPDHDPHSFVASLAFTQYTGLSLKDPNHAKATADSNIRKCHCDTCKRKLLRDIIKRVFYGLGYGAGAQTVLEAIYNGGYEGPPLTVAMIEHVKKTIFATFDGIPVWRDEKVKKAKLDGALFSPLMHRRRIFPLAGVAPGIEIPITEIYNFDIQAGGADIINEAFIKFEAGLRDVDETAFIIAQIHDAIYVEASEKRGEAVKRWLVQCMTMEKTHNGVTMRFSASGKVGHTLVA